MRDWEAAKDSRVVCYCKQVQKRTIVKAIKAGCTTLQEVQDATGACTGSQCKRLNPEGRCCSTDIEELLRLYSHSCPPKTCCGMGCCQ